MGCGHIFGHVWGCLLFCVFLNFGDSLHFFACVYFWLVFLYGVTIIFVIIYGVSLFFGLSSFLEVVFIFEIILNFLFLFNFRSSLFLVSSLYLGSSSSLEGSCGCLYFGVVFILMGPRQDPQMALLIVPPMGFPRSPMTGLPTHCKFLANTDRQTHRQTE